MPQQLHKKTGMDEKIRLIFTTEKPLAWQFRPRHETPPCPEPCLACRTAARQGACYTKNAVYQVTCSICKAVYVGQTERTMGSRITEHIKGPNSHVHLHMATHGIDHKTAFTWRVLATHPYATTRLALEALFIRRTDQKMNGCEGARLLSFVE